MDGPGGGIFRVESDGHRLHWRRQHRVAQRAENALALNMLQTNKVVPRDVWRSVQSFDMDGAGNATARLPPGLPLRGRRGKWQTHS